jgi:hypothetical protein
MFIPDPKKHGEVKKIFYISVFLPFCSFPLLLKQILTHNCCTEFIQFNNYCILNYFHFLTQENIGFKLSEIMVGSGIWDPGSGKNLSRIQGSKRYRIPDPDPQH